MRRRGPCDGGRWSGLLGLGLLLFCALSAEAATYYVATTGNDANPGTQDQPWQTPQRAADAPLQAGDTVLFRAGRYPGFVFRSTPTGTANAPIIFKPSPGEHVVFDGALMEPWQHTIVFDAGARHVILEGFEITESRTTVPSDARSGMSGIKIYCVSVDAEGYCVDGGGPMTLRNLEIHHGTGMGIQGGNDDMVIENTYVHHRGRKQDGTAWGFGGYGMYLGGRRVIVRGNRVEHNSGNGIRCCNPQHPSYWGYDMIVENNIVKDNWLDGGWHNDIWYAPFGGDGIVLWGTTGTTVHNNVVYGKHEFGIRMLKPGNTVYNNTVTGSINQGIYIYDGESSIVSNNLLYGNGMNPEYSGDLHLGGGSGANNLTGVDPKFVNAAAGDFHLQAGSPAINAGLTLPDVPCDHDGNQRPAGGAYDIGAYEYGASPGGGCGGGSTPIRGDLNGDGKRDLVDVRLLIYMLIGQQPKTPEAELTGDGAVTLADVQALIKLLVGIP